MTSLGNLANRHDPAWWFVLRTLAMAFGLWFAFGIAAAGLVDTFSIPNRAKDLLYGLCMHLIPALLLVRLRGIPLDKAFPFNLSGWKLALGVPILAITVSACNATLVFALGLSDLAPSVPHIQERFASQAWPEILLAMTGMVILTPLFEEVFFRGGLFAALAQRLPDQTTIAVTGTVFALAHLDRGIVMLPYYLMVGCLFSWLRCRTQSLTASILAHMGVNGTAAALGWLLKSASI